MNPIFATSQHQDSQELLEYLMTGLNEGLNKVRVLFNCRTVIGFWCLYVSLNGGKWCLNHKNHHNGAGWCLSVALFDKM